MALLKRNTEHTTTMARSPFNRTDAWSSYHAVYLPSITYPMSSSCLSTKHCNTLQRQFKKVLLPKCGYNRTTPNSVVYGSQDYGGIGLRQLYIERGIAQVYTLMACLRSDGLLSDLALIMISWGQCLAGTSFPLLSDVKTPLPHLHPMTWLPSVRDFLAEIDCTLELSNSFITDLQRENDTFIMDHALRFTSKGKDLQILNACRLYLGVLLISDIATCEGTHLALFAYQGNLPSDSSVRGLTPYQDRPHDAAWELWRNILTTTILSDTDPNPLALRTTLGRWLVTGSKTHRKWSAYHCVRSK